ncbi:MAG: cytochrome b/b6 domain-containing protein [Acidimicrobiia bacterium]
MAESYPRFTVSDRIEHWAQVVSFTVLAITGLVQKWPELGLTDTIINWLGGIEATRLIHHIAAAVLLLAVVYHVGTAGYRLYVLRQGKLMYPSMRDAWAAIHAVGYNLGLREEPPKEGHFTFAEKAEYLSIIWGTAVMAVTGFMMWNPIATTALLPGQFIPAAKAAHGGEAILAVLAIIVWHVYHVHIKSLNMSMFNGLLTQHEMEEEHGRELDLIEVGEAEAPLPSVGVVEKRRKIFMPVYALVAIVLLGGVYLFLTFEQTAILTITPPEQVQIYQPGPTTTTTLP